MWMTDFFRWEGKCVNNTNTMKWLGGKNVDFSYDFFLVI